MKYCKYVRSIYQKKKYHSIRCATSLTESEPFKLLPHREDKWFLATFNGQKEQAMKMETEKETESQLKLWRGREWQRLVG